MARLIQLCVTLGCLALAFACSSSNEVRYASPYSARWVRQQIEAYETPGAEPASRVIRKVTYSGKPAYLIASPCCDQFDYLYDTMGVILCAPSGGFTGRGDDSCPDVASAADVNAPNAL